MKQIKAKNSVLAIALLILFSALIAISALAQTNAQPVTGWKQTYAFLGFSRNPIGVGQVEVLDVGISDPLPQVGEGWTGLSVTVVKPDGTTTTISPITTDSTGGVGVNFIPTEVGNYTLQSHFPAQWLNYTGFSIFGFPQASNILYEASSSPNVTLTVQKSPVPTYPVAPLPTSYWTNPINDQLSSWSSIAGNWITPWDFNPLQNFVATGDDQAPQSAHILWTKPIAAGGVVGPPVNSSDYDTGEAYEYQFAGSMIINGVLYYNEYPSDYATQRLIAVDLRTGQQLWADNRVWANYAQLMTFNTQNQHGTFAYIWARNVSASFFGFTQGAPSTWYAYDAVTGDWVYTMTNVPYGTVMTGPNGEILILVINQAAGWMALWNSSAVPALWGGPPYMTTPMIWNTWRPQGKTVDAQAPCPVTPVDPIGVSGYEWNVTIPTSSIIAQSSIVTAIPGDLVLGCWRGANTINEVTITGATDQFYAWAISLNPATLGKLLWSKTEPLPPGNLTITSFFGPVDQQSGVWCVFLKETRQWVGYSLDTGDQLWITASQTFLDQYTTIGSIWGNNADIANGILYSIHYGGILYAYNVTTGKTLWTYANADLYGQELRNTNFPSDIDFITDGMIVISPSEFNPISPRPYGSNTVCLNATTGQVIWSLNLCKPGGSGEPIIGDDIIAALNEYDNQIYAIGKGPTQTTVTAPDEGFNLGNNIVIRGTVMDISAGTTQSGMAARFPNGVPAVSDASESAWMQYVYMQFPAPTNATGVPVTLSVTDSNGNHYVIGTATTDTSGMFTLTYTPTIPGNFTVYANFAGTNSYYPSSAETSFTVESAAPTAPPTAPPITGLASTGTVELGIVAVIIVIVIIGAMLAVLTVRKHP
jgi:outer membrane protein assembly factor BamB